MNGLKTKAGADRTLNQKMILFLMGNGSLQATSSQELYELAWTNGIRPVNERRLKSNRRFRGQVC